LPYISGWTAKFAYEHTPCVTKTQRKSAVNEINFGGVWMSVGNYGGFNAKARRRWQGTCGILDGYGATPGAEAFRPLRA
jgi:hypothetical protein